MGQKKQSGNHFSVKILLCAVGLCLIVPMAGATEPVVRMTTSLGTVDIQLLPSSAPNTVTNFLRYADRNPNGYNGTFIHRASPDGPDFFVQGGGFITSTFVDNGNSTTATPIPTDPPIMNEFHLSNVRGTLAMAKLSGDPNSATSQWFFNLVNNSPTFDTTDGGYTVFGRVIGDGMTVVDAIGALPHLRAVVGDGIPVHDFVTGMLATPANLVNITIMRLAEATADFTNDGKLDILWQNSVTGQRSIWRMNGTTYSSSASLPTVSIQWNIAGAGDFNNDGKADIVLQNSVTGQRALWLMNGTTYSAGMSLPTVATQWSIAGVGDFNGDYKPDILWQNTATGQHAVWLMNGTAYSSSVNLPAVATQWSIAAVEDFNGDDKPDLLWQNTATGQRSIWLMNGTVRTSSVNLPTVATQWKIVGAGDFNGDYKSDILWENTATGQRAIWLMNGTGRIGGANLPTVSTQWDIRNH